MFHTEIKISPELLIEDAKHVTLYFFTAARERIDEEFGDGYAAKHPELVATYIKVAGDSYNATNKIQFGQEVSAVLCDILSEISSSLREYLAEQQLREVGE